MSGSSTVAVGFLSVFFFFLIAAGPVLMFVIERRLPWGISRRLQHGRKFITIRTRYAGGTWNPARPRGPGNHTPNEPGWATYTLTDDGLVQLDLVRADGRREQFIGPPVEPPDGYRRARRAGAVPTLVYLGCAGIGFGLGFGLTDSANAGSRIEAGILAALGGWIIAWFGLTLASAVGRSRAQRAHDAAADHEPEH